MTPHLHLRKQYKTWARLSSACDLPLTVNEVREKGRSVLTKDTKPPGMASHFLPGISLSTQGVWRTRKEIPTHLACSFLISSNPILMKLRAAHGKNISRYCVQVRLVETFPKPIRRNRGPELSDSPDLKHAYPTCQVTSSIIRDNCVIQQHLFVGILRDV